ncbi:MAG TPA: SOS response-associated peptidase family protein [Kofleriaceae bacterium]|nr:SOS response-associated peptidase family protein [Kofleriaceae bacterium]
MIDRYTLTARARYNIAHEQVAPVERLVDKQPATVDMRWGMLAPFRGHGGKRPPTIYAAPVDAIDATPALRNALRSARCRVLADGFYVWRKLGPGKRQPYWIHAAQPTAFAGLYDLERDREPRFTIVVAPAPPALAQVTDVVPVLAPSTWLGPVDDARAVLALPIDGLRADAVSTWVNDEAHDDPRCIALLGNPNQGNLF